MSKKSILIIIGTIAVCVVAYFITFHVPRPVLFSWEKIADYETAMSFFAEDGTEETLQFDIGVIPVGVNDGSVISTISKENLEEILKTTKCLRILRSPPFYYEEYNVFTIDTATDKGPLHIIVGEETALWYRSGDDFFKYSIIDMQTFYERMTAVFRYEKNSNISAGSPGDTLSQKDLSDTGKSMDDPWYQVPSVDPVETVRSAIENQINKDYTISIEVESIVIDEAETVRVIENYSGSELAQARGWTDDLLAEHFIVVKAAYNVEYDHTKTFIPDGYIVQYFYLTQDIKSGKWTIVDGTANIAEKF